MSWQCPSMFVAQCATRNSSSDNESLSRDMGSTGKKRIKISIEVIEDSNRFKWLISWIDVDRDWDYDCTPQELQLRANVQSVHRQRWCVEEIQQAHLESIDIGESWAKLCFQVMFCWRWDLPIKFKNSGWITVCVLTTEPWLDPFPWHSPAPEKDVDVNSSTAFNIFQLGCPCFQSETFSSPVARRMLWNVKHPEHPAFLVFLLCVRS